MVGLRNVASGGGGGKNTHGNAVPGSLKVSETMHHVCAFFNAPDHLQLSLFLYASCPTRAFIDDSQQDAPSNVVTLSQAPVLYFSRRIRKTCCNNFNRKKSPQLKYGTTDLA